MRYNNVIESFLDRRVASSGNYISTGDSLLLFGKKIATYQNNNVVVTACGYSTSTTAKALNCLADKRHGIVSRIILGNKPRMIIDDKHVNEIDTRQWINLDTGDVY